MKLRKKLREIAGESMVEILLALLIAVLSISFLSEAVVTANEVNKANREYNGGFEYTYTDEHKVRNTGDFSYGDSNESLTVTVYENNGFYFAK